VHQSIHLVHPPPTWNVVQLVGEHPVGQSGVDGHAGVEGCPGVRLLPVGQRGSVQDDPDEERRRFFVELREEVGRTHSADFLHEAIGGQLAVLLHPLHPAAVVVVVHLISGRSMASSDAIEAPPRCQMSGRRSGADVVEPVVILAHTLKHSVLHEGFQRHLAAQLANQLLGSCSAALIISTLTFHSVSINSI